MGDENNTSPEPFVFGPSQAFEGNDGRWSTFIVRVGTPEQNFKILPSTAGEQLFLPLPEGCTDDDDDPADCPELRGVYPFNGEATGFQPNASSTWKAIGLYNLLLGSQYGLEGGGLYGFDTVGFMVQNSGGLTATDQVVAGISTKDYYLGVLGLGPRPSNFSDFDYPQRSIMRTLKDEKKIPSLSYGYTAGAAYRIPRVAGSLTLGGYDFSRFENNDQTFPFGTDEGRRLELGVQRISATNTLLGAHSFLNNHILSVIDSTYPHIWLPRDACDAFEEAFGLTYDENTDLYLVNDTIHDELKRLDPIVTFHLGNTNSPTEMVNIKVPYGAFDLQASHPIYENATNYFPIRRAANDSQYTLGRTFLQEAYIIADYERSNFSVFQSAFDSPMPEQEIVTILPPTVPKERTYTPHTPTGIPKGAIIGIAVGVGILVMVLLALFIFFIRRRRASRRVQIPPSNQQPPVSHHHGGEADSKQRFELYNPPGELSSNPHSGAVEMDNEAKQRYLVSDDAAGRKPLEMTGEDARHEMPGDRGADNLRYELYGTPLSEIPKEKLHSGPDAHEQYRR